VQKRNRRVHAKVALLDPALENLDPSGCTDLLAVTLAAS